MTAVQPASEPRTETAPGQRWLLPAVWVAAAGLGYAYLGRGWIAHDVGTLGHAAERVLAGELPHRDFVDVYTGGQAMLHALAFRVFGTELMTLRFVFFAAYLLWVPLAWLAARRFAGPGLTAAATLLVAALTLPAYPEGMPSWYNLFFATAGVVCLLQHREREQARWLALAGLAGGVSILFKVVGLYYVAGALLFLLYLETTEEPGSEPGADAAYRVAAALACVVLAFAALYVVAAAGGGIGLVYFALPPLAAVVVVAARLTAPTGRTSSARFRSLMRTSLPFVAGVAAPVAAFVVPYLRSGSLGALYEGVFVLPRARLEFPAENALPVLGFLPAALLAAWLASSRRTTRLVGGACVLAVLGSTHLDPLYRVVWWTLISLGPVAAVAGAWQLARSNGNGTARRTGAFLLLAVFSYANLVQLPYSAPVYFLYAAPLLLLLGVALAGSGRSPSPRPFTLLVAGLLAFAVFRIDAGFIHHLGFRYRPHEETEPLALERARGIRVSASEKAEVEQLVGALDRIGGGRAILALPDAPEVYFLAARANPSRTLFDVFEDTSTRATRVLSIVDDARLSVVVLNRSPIFAPPVDGPLLEGLRARFDWSAEVGRYQILWAGPARSTPGAP
jgi:hypothetical protein